MGNRIGTGIAARNLADVIITDGLMDGVIIGSAIPAASFFTSVTATNDFVGTRIGLGTSTTPGSALEAVGDASVWASFEDTTNNVSADFGVDDIQAFSFVASNHPYMIGTNGTIRMTVEAGGNIVMANELSVAGELNGLNGLNITGNADVTGTLHSDLALTSGNNIGAGISTPASRFHGQANGLIQLELNDLTAGSTLTAGAGAGGGFVNVNTNHDFQLMTNGVSRLTVSATGVVTVGSTIGTRAALIVTGNVNTDNGTYGFFASGGASGGAGPGAVLTSIFANDRVVATEFNAFSDVRVKENVFEVKGALSILESLTPVGYNKMSQSGPAVGEYGFIAQDVARAMPIAVRTSTGDVPDGEGGWKEVDDYHTLNYQSIFAVAVAAIKELQEEVRELKALINSTEIHR